VSRVPIRIRLTAAFALAMVLVLAAAGIFVYLRLADDLNESVDAALQSRAAAVLSSGSPAAGTPGDPEEGFAVLVNPGGQARGLRADELRRAAAGEQVMVERDVPGIEGSTRVLARSEGGQVAVVGQSLDDRDETLANLVASFAIGGPIAVLLASLLGYGLAAAALRPVEAMRRRAEEVSLADGAQRLPLPEARDEIHALGETLNEMLERLRRSFERERSFVADASHELRTPVAVIKTEIEGALRAGGHDPQVHEALVASLEECDHLGQLAEDLLVVARAGEDELELHPGSLDARELLERTRGRFADRAGERGRSIRVAADDGQVVYGDELRLRQALGNLVDNALRHGSGEIELSSQRDAKGVQLAVSDAGAGFDPEFAARAFDRFTRGDIARSSSGTGLGLSIVRTIAEAHGGRAEVAPGPGATVRIWLPDGPGTVSGTSQVADLTSRSEDTTPVRGGKGR
jgi:two-component system, OmpR family, sensor kinase